ncbi:hypothetical protein AVEN_154065-1 [Araneus ventricosus]|uniref:SAM domain-containing protein n=1 Tax=Araneus ventricosus TaxID=182803 RepID=A0A4Y2IY30_ARAVE|nr:hypothetical protein AVEN_154065-1 [Araneus ventricosus]
MDIEEKLKEWGFEELAQEFTENGINMEVLKICSIEDISSLLSPLNLGSKIIFKRKLEEFQKGAVWMENCSEVPVDVENEIIPSCSREYSPCSRKYSPCSREYSPHTASTSEVPVDVENEIIPSCSRDYSPCSRKYSPCSGECSSHTASTSEVFDKTPVAIASCPTASFPKVTRNYSPNRILKDKSRMTESPEIMVRKSFKYDELYYEVLDKNLKENVFGRSITSFYGKTGYLDRSNRNKLAKLIISLELEDNLDKSITSERFLQLRDAIVKIFPTETKETWYTPYQYVENDRKVNAKGKLVDLYHNNRKNLIKLGIITRRGRARTCSTPKPDEGVIFQQDGASGYNIPPAVDRQGCCHGMATTIPGHNAIRLLLVGLCVATCVQ